MNSHDGPKLRLETKALLDSLEVEELEHAAGGDGILTDVNENCGSCTCPPAGFIDPAP